MPFIHAHQFRRQYEAFWTDPASTGLLWISLLFLIFGAGALLAKAKLANEPGLLASVEEPAFYLGVSARCLVTGRLPGGQAVLQDAHSRNMQRQDEDCVLWALYGLAARMAQLQGYHRDPSRLPRAREARLRARCARRTWFMIQSAELLDEDFDEDTAVLPRTRRPSSPTLPS
ncbi:hypothetical protein MY11210_009247 [Beauveria gryllotalpidicola]